MLGEILVNYDLLKKDERGGVMKRKLRIFTLAVLILSLTCVISGCSKSEPADEVANDTSLEIPDDKFGVGDDPFYVLIVGNDSRAGTVDAKEGDSDRGPAYSDTIILTRVDPRDCKITLVSIPRDTKVSFNGENVKINDTYYQGGVSALVESVEELTGVEIAYTFETGFARFTSLVDAWGGLTANVPIDLSLKSVTSGQKVSLPAGVSDLTGEEALVLARSRKQYADDMDACRQVQNRQLVQAAIQKIASDPDNIDAYVNAFTQNVYTDLNNEALLDLVSKFVKSAEGITVLSGTGPYKGGIDSETQLWMVYEDDSGVWQELMKVVDDGGDPQSVVRDPEVIAG